MTITEYIKNKIETQLDEAIPFDAEALNNISSTKTHFGDNFCIGDKMCFVMVRNKTKDVTPGAMLELNMNFVKFKESEIPLFDNEYELLGGDLMSKETTIKKASLCNSCHEVHTHDYIENKKYYIDNDGYCGECGVYNVSYDVNRKLDNMGL